MERQGLAVVGEKEAGWEEGAHSVNGFVQAVMPDGLSEGLPAVHALADQDENDQAWRAAIMLNISAKVLAIISRLNILCLGKIRLKISGIRVKSGHLSLLGQTWCV